MTRKTRSESEVVTLRTRESLCLDLDDAYDKIERMQSVISRAQTAVEELKVMIADITKDWGTERTVFVNQISTLKKENDELRNRRD